MLLKTEKKMFGDIQFTTTTFPAMQALEMMGLVGEDHGPKEMAQYAPEFLKSTAAILTDQTGPKQVPLNSRENIDLVFSGRLPTLFKVWEWVSKVNYGDFSQGSDPSAPQTPSSSSS